MGHDHHFLSRLDRVKRETVDFALSIYRDSELVQWLLATTDLPEGAPRAAIALDQSATPPHIVVTPDGHFVTCLGEGMATGDLPIISRSKLDACLKNVDRWRSREARAKEVVRPGGEQVDLFRLVHVRADELSREEFEALACWSPILGVDYFRSAIATAVDLQKLHYTLIALREKADEAVLRSYWESTWSVGHLMLLGASADPSLLDSLIDIGETVDATMTGIAFQQGLMGVAARGSWVAARLATRVLPIYKRHFAAPKGKNEALDAVVGLYAIRASHSRRRAEISKFLDKPRSEAPKPHEVLPNVAAMLGAFALDVSDETAESIVTDLGRRMCMIMTEYLPRDHALAFPREEDVPESYALAAAANYPGHFFRNDDNATLTILFALAHVFARRKPEEFYLPQALRDCVGSQYSRELALDLIQSQRLFIVGKQSPVIKAKAVGRNDPCPCGTGKKYKRCCGA